MIFVATAAALVLTIWLVALNGRVGEDASLPNRLATVALLPAAVVAMVGLFYSILSLPIVGVNLDQATLAELRALEAQVPAWATAFADHWLPKWYVTAGVALIALFLSALRVNARNDRELRRINFWNRVVERVRDTIHIANVFALVLIAASAVTVFGDGLKDTRDDVLSNIHQAEFRFEVGTDLLISTLANEIVELSVNKMLTNIAKPNTTLGQEIKRSLATFRAAFLEYTRAPRHDAESQRAILAGLEIVADMGSVSPAEIFNMASRSSLSDAGEYAQNSPLSDLAFRDHVKQAALTMLAPDTDSTHTQRPKRREVAKELLGAVVDQLKKAASENPVMDLFAEPIGSMVAEVFAEVSSRSALEPMLQRLWNAADSDTWRETAKVEVKNVVDAIDTSRHWSSVGRGNAKAYADWSATLSAAAESLRAAGLIPSEPDLVNRGGILRGLTRGATLAPSAEIPSLQQLSLSRVSQPDSLSREELERLAALFDHIGRPHSAETLRSLVSAENLEPEALDTSVTDLLAAASAHLSKHSVLASSRYSVDRSPSHLPKALIPDFGERQFSLSTEAERAKLPPPSRPVRPFRFPFK